MAKEKKNNDNNDGNLISYLIPTSNESFFGQRLTSNFQGSDLKPANLHVKTSTSCVAPQCDMKCMNYIFMFVSQVIPFQYFHFQ